MMEHLQGSALHIIDGGKSFTKGKECCLSTVTESQLCEDVTYMCAYRCLTDVEYIGYFVVTEASSYLAQDILFTV